MAKLAMLEDFLSTNSSGLGTIFAYSKGSTVPTCNVCDLSGQTEVCGAGTGTDRYSWETELYVVPVQVQTGTAQSDFRVHKCWFSLWKVYMSSP